MTFYGINTIFPKSEDFCRPYEKSSSEINKKICPAVCVPLYEIIKNQCVYNECGSGCGPNNISTFTNMEECKQAVYNFKCPEYPKDLIIFLLSLMGLIILIWITDYLNKKVEKRNKKRKK